ncbi:MAG: M28 family peptidase [Spirochaetaceae bacterium]|nr:M28 family peptidase [Spirochaetaceae bacterium]
MSTDFLPAGFLEFLKPDVDRAHFIEKWLDLHKIENSTIVIDGSRHIYVQLRRECYNSAFKVKTLIAHYDRTHGSPGANDNSAAVFQLMLLAERLMHTAEVHNVRIIFADSEELGHLEDQGTYKIAKRFSELNIVSDDVFVFDCCGRGDALVISTAGKTTEGGLDFERGFADLLTRAQKLAQTTMPNNFYSLPVPYSDNAAFLAVRIPAVAVAVLPSDEAKRLRVQSQCKHITQKNLYLGDKKLLKILPETWQLIHTGNDTAESLTPEAFVLMQSFLDAIARTNTPR